ncbi:MAG: hypothetical protein AABY93_11510 [Bacteroidota bacterium]
MTVGINQELSPIKFCFFIKPEIQSLFRATQLANSFWGGRHSPIFPIIEEFDRNFRVIFGAQETVEQFYQNVLINYNPDIIVIEDGLNLELISRISNDRTTLSLNDLEKDILGLENRYGLTILEIVTEIVNEMFEFKRNDDLHINLAKNEKDDPLISILFNTPLKSFHENINTNLEKKAFFKVSDVKITDLYSIWSDNSINYTRINIFDLRKLRSFGDHYEYVFIFKRDDFYSLTILWNLKAAGRKVFAFPITDYNTEGLDNSLLDFYEDSKSEHFGPSIFYGPQLTAGEINDAFAHIKKVVHAKYSNVNITHQPWIPRFGSEGEVAQRDGVVSSVFVLKTHYDQVKSDEGYLRYNLLSSDFKITKHSHRKTHKVTSYIKYHDHLLNYPSVIDGINSLDWVRMTQSMSTEDCRISNGGIVRFCEGDRSDMHFRIPETSDYLKTFFNKKGLVFSIPPQGELTKQIFKNIGGTYGIGRFSSSGAIKVLEALESSTILPTEHLVSLIQKHKPLNFDKRPFDFIQILIENNIIELGAYIQCTICYQRSFYSITELSTQVVCKNCRSTFSVPQNNPKKTFKWSYRGIGPFSKSNKIDGLLSCFLTLNLFDHGIYAANDGITSFMNFLLQRNDKSMEVDLMLQLREERFTENNTELIFCECKTYKYFDQIDIDRLKFLGEQFPGSILVLSTLNESLTADEVTLISSLVNHFRKGNGKRPLNPVFILTANELLPKRLFNPFEHFGKIHNAIRYNDYLGFLSEKSSEIYLKLKMWNDIKMDEWREEQNRRRHIGGIVHSLLKRVRK